MFLVRNCDLLLMRTCYPKQAWIVVEVSAGLEQLTLHLSRVWTPMMSVSAVEELTYEEAFPEAVEKMASSKEASLGLGLDDVRDSDFSPGFKFSASLFREDFVLSLEISPCLH